MFVKRLGIAVICSYWPSFCPEMSPSSDNRPLYPHSHVTKGWLTQTMFMWPLWLDEGLVVHLKKVPVLWPGVLFVLFLLLKVLSWRQPFHSHTFLLVHSCHYKWLQTKPSTSSTVMLKSRWHTWCKDKGQWEGEWEKVEDSYRLTWMK